MCELCTVMCAREKCASAHVQGGVVSTCREQCVDGAMNFMRVNTALLARRTPLLEPVHEHCFAGAMYSVN